MRKVLLARPGSLGLTPQDRLGLLICDAGATADEECCSSGLKNDAPGVVRDHGLNRMLRPGARNSHTAGWGSGRQRSRRSLEHRWLSRSRRCLGRPPHCRRSRLSPLCRSRQLLDPVTRMAKIVPQFRPAARRPALLLGKSTRPMRKLTQLISYPNNVHSAGGFGSPLVEDPETGVDWGLEKSPGPRLSTRGYKSGRRFSYSCEVPMPFIRLPAFIPVPLLFML